MAQGRGLLTSSGSTAVPVVSNFETLRAFLSNTFGISCFFVSIDMGQPDRSRCTQWIQLLGSYITAMGSVSPSAAKAGSPVLKGECLAFCEYDTGM